MFWENFYNLCKSNSTTPNAICSELGLSTATATGWKKRGVSPSGDILLRISEYFGVSTDFLLTGKEREKNNLLTDDEQVLRKSFRYLNEDGKEKILDFIDDLVQSGKYKKYPSDNVDKKEVI